MNADYAVELTVAKNSATSVRSATKLKWSPFRAYQLLMTFPSGCANLVGVRVFHQGRQVLPTTENVEYKADNYTYVIQLDNKYEETPYEFEFYVSNKDTKNAHTVYIHFVGRLIDLAGDPLELFTVAFYRLFGSLQ